MSVRKKAIASLSLVAALAVGSLTVGCASSSKLNQMPSEAAWTEVENNARTGNMMDNIPMPEEMGGVNWSQLMGDAEKRAAEAAKDADTPTEALDYIVADVSEYLVTALPKHQKVSGSQWRLTLALGTLIDKTEDQRLATALSEIAYNLQKNDAFARHFKVLSSSMTDAEAVINELAVSHPDDVYSPTDKSDSGVAKVHPDDLYVLTGETSVWAEDRNRKLTTRTMIRVEHPKSRETVVTELFKRTYYFHPGLMKYIPETEDQKLANAWAARKK